MFAVPALKRLIVLVFGVVAACLSPKFSLAQKAADAPACTPLTCSYLNPALRAGGTRKGSGWPDDA